MNYLRIAACHVLVLCLVPTSVHGGHYPYTIGFVSELDGVVATRDWRTIAKNLYKIFLQAENKTELIRLCVNPSFLLDCKRGFFHTLKAHKTTLKHTEHIVLYLVSKYPALYPHHHKLTAALHEYQLNKEIISLFILLKKIHNPSYRLFLVTNKNKYSLNMAQQKISPLLEKQFGISWNELFDGVFYEDKQDPNHRRYAKRRMPHPEFFVGLWEYLTEKKNFSAQNSRLIFINGKERHTEGARMARQTTLIPLYPILYQNLSCLEQGIAQELEAGN